MQKKLMSFAEYARHRKCSKSYISQLKSKGVLVLQGRSVDVSATDRVLNGEATAAIPVGKAETPQTLTDVRIEDLVWRAKLRRLEFERESGKLMPVAEIQAEVGARFGADAESLQNAPSRYEAELADQFQIPERIMRSILDRFVRLHRLERSGAKADEPDPRASQENRNAG